MQAISSALGGLHRAETLLNQTASQLAQSPFAAPEDQISLSDAAVALIEARSSYQANLNSIKVADQMQKSTLSLIA